MTTTATQEISLLDYNNTINPVTYLWVCGVGCPTGSEYNHSDQDEDYCDVGEVISELGLWELSGKVVDGRWEWDGNGEPRDLRGNSILNVKAM